LSLKRGFLLAGVLFLLLLGWVGARGYLAREHLLKARAEVAQLQTAITAGHLDGLAARLETIRHEAQAAHALTSDPVWSGLSNVPWFGSTLDAAKQVATSVDQVASQVLPPLVHAADLIEPRTLRAPDGTLKLARLSAAVPALKSSTAALASARARLRSTPTDGVAAAITKAQQTLAHLLDGLAGSLDMAYRAARIAPDMAGANGPRRYLVIFQTPAEARGTGGLSGSYAVIRITNGKVITERSGSDLELKESSSPVVDLGADFNARYRAVESTSSWLNANFTPHFPWAAEIWAKLWQRQSGERMDGVIAVDPIALGYLMKLTGPVTLSDGEVITANNAARWAMSDSYRIYANNQPLRKKLAAQLSRRTLDRLSGSNIDFTELLKVAGRAAGEHRLLLWSANPAEQSLIAGTPAAGVLSAAPGPFAELVLENGGGNKLDYYLERALSYKVLSCGPQKRTARVSFTLTNKAPASGLPIYVTTRSDHRVVPVGQTRVFADLYLAHGAVMETWSMGGHKIPARLSLERGHSVVEFDIEIPPGQSRTVTATVTEPPSTAKVLIPVQPLVHPLVVSSTGSC
jgi:hypothetical protein